MKKLLSLVFIAVLLSGCATLNDRLEQSKAPPSAPSPIIPDPTDSSGLTTIASRPNFRIPGAATMADAKPESMPQPYALKDAAGNVLFIFNIVRSGPDLVYQYVGETGLVEVTLIDNGVLQ